MEESIRKTLKQGEDSKNQFKKNITNSKALAAEMIAYSNSGGGKLFIGVNDDGSIAGLTKEDICRLNQLISNTASDNVQPPISPISTNITIDNKIIIIVEIKNGINKPYQTKDGVFWVKNGADKRKATSREEIQRLFQSSGLIQADEILTNNATIADLDLDYFRTFFEQRYGEPLDNQKLELSQIVNNMNLGKDGKLNITGALLFGKQPSSKLPVFIVKAGSFPGNNVTTNHYLDSRDITGKIETIFAETVSFILANIKHIQGDQHVNSIGKPEIPRLTIEELVANAIIHRNYFISAPIRVFIFENRVEIISPGHLPNSLTVENIKKGNSNSRNPILASFANQIIPYRGYGSGILRALQNYRAITFEDDRDGNLFKVTIAREEHN